MERYSMDKLIFGKSNLTRIVSIEPTDDGTEVFIQQQDGFVTSQILPNEYWLLANKCLDPHFKALKGNLHYKWIKTFKTRRSFTSDRHRYKGEDIFSIWNSKEALMVREGLTYFKDLKHTDVSVLSFDIETTGLFHDSSSKVLIISNTYSSQDKLERKMFTYDEYDNEGEMIKAWCEWVNEKDPSLLVGHNIVMFDLPYLNFIANKYGVHLTLGRNGDDITFDTYDSKFRKDSTNFYEFKKVHVYGREVIDTLFLSYKYDIGRKYETYGLKNIIKQEGLEVKDRQFYDAGQIRLKYKDPVEWKKIKEYAMFDADDSLNLYNLMCATSFYWTQSVARSYQHVIESASGGQINTMMNRAYIQGGHSISKVTQSIVFEGATSDSTSGVYSNCIKWDISSLYPSIILQYEVYDKIKDPLGYLLELCRYFTKKRLEYKKLAKNDEYYEALQLTLKQGINSMYGYMASKYNNNNYPEGAAFITRTGREILAKAIKWATGEDYVK